MLMQRTARTGSICGMLVSLLFFSGTAAASDGADAVVATQGTLALVWRLIREGYDVAPALMLGLGLLAVIPFLAVSAPVITRARRPSDATQRYNGELTDVSDDIDGEAAQLPPHAFLEVVDGPDTKFAILRDMLRIGREDDNDIRIPSPAVHRYHAAIHREHMEDWHITDLSGINGNGIRVNGQKCADATLHDGDVIELGPGRLRFRAGLI
jgi:hypothetical protein